jgi:hypothetical protein
MGQHAKGRLGPAGRRELVRLMLVVGVSERGGGRLPLGRAGDGAQVDGPVRGGLGG